MKLLGLSVYQLLDILYLDNMRWKKRDRKREHKEKKPKKPKKGKKMAISWDIEITNVNLQNERGTVIATRTDSESALAPRVHTLTNTPLGTPEDRIQVLDTIKEWDEAAVSYSEAVETFIDDLEQSGKTNLENWELTR